MITWKQALREARETGLSRCPDYALMAAFCQNELQLLVGAVSARRVWEGAMEKHMTCHELAALVQSDPIAAADLMWYHPGGE